MKGKACNALIQLIDTNYIQLEVMGWVKKAKSKK